MNKEYKSSDHKRAYNKAYYEKNKEIIRIKMAVYNGTEKQKKINAENHKKYYENNKQAILKRIRNNYWEAQGIWPPNKKYPTKADWEALEKWENDEDDHGDPP